MNSMTCLPTTAEKREMMLAQLRVERLQQQLVVAHIDFIATGVQSGFIPPDSVPLLIAEAFGTPEGQSDG